MPEVVLALKLCTPRCQAATLSHGSVSGAASPLSRNSETTPQLSIQNWLSTYNAPQHSPRSSVRSSRNNSLEHLGSRLPRAGTSPQPSVVARVAWGPLLPLLLALVLLGADSDFAAFGRPGPPGGRSSGAIGCTHTHTLSLPLLTSSHGGAAPCKEYLA